MLGSEPLEDFVPGHQPRGSDESLYIVFSGDSPLIPVKDNWRPMQAQEWRWSGLELVQEGLCIGSWDGRDCFAVQIECADTVASEWLVADMRTMLGRMDSAGFSVFSRARQMLEWRRTNAFCGVCGGETSLHTKEQAFGCGRCGQLSYPRVSPCVIVLVTRGDELLLGRNANFPEAFYSTLAGFVEPGETVEMALEREVLEETGICCQRPRYFGSQAWPFPSQLMLGFYAEYLSGNPQPDMEEVIDVRWWHRDELPRIPPPSSISGTLIQHYLEQLPN